MDTNILGKIEKSNSQTYSISQKGRITSNKSALLRVTLFTTLLTLSGFLAFVKSLIILDNKAEYLNIVVTKAYYVAPAGIVIAASGIFIMLTAYLRPQEVILLNDRIEVINKFSKLSVEWQKIDLFRPDILGLSVSAMYNDNKSHKGLGGSFRVPLVGNNAAEFSEALNTFRRNKMLKTC